MLQIDKHLIFIKKDQFLKEKYTELLIKKGLDKTSLIQQEKNESLNLLIERLNQRPLLGSLTAAFVEVKEDDLLETAESVIDRIADFAYLFFVCDRIPYRVNSKIKNAFQFRDALDEDEINEILTNFLSLIGKKVSVTARNFLVQKMSENANNTIQILLKLSSLIPHLYIDETIIKNSFEDVITNFQTPLLFFKAKGLQAVKIIENSDYSAFRTLYLNFLMNLIKFKLAEDKSFGEKMRILKSSPATAQKFIDLVHPYSLASLEERFLFYFTVLKQPQDIFIVKHLTKKW